MTLPADPGSCVTLPAWIDSRVGTPRVATIRDKSARGETRRRGADRIRMDVPGRLPIGRRPVGNRRPPRVPRPRLEDRTIREIRAARPSGPRGDSPLGRHLQGERQRDEPFSISHRRPDVARLRPDLLALHRPRGEAPIRAELYGLDRLEALARRLASAAVVDAGLKAGDLLLRRFAENGEVLFKTHRRIVSEVDRPEGRGIDAEWLADNFHIVEDVLREIKQDLPSGYYSELPKLAVGEVRGYPRVYTLALALVAHTDSELDEARIGRFVESFQAVAPLTIGELWAVPTMLRLVLVENLRRLAERMVRSWDESRQADAWVLQNLPAPAPEEAEADREPAALESPPPFPATTDPMVVRLVRLLRDRGAAASPALRKLESELAARGNDAGQVLRDEHRRQAANQVSVGNCVISLRLLSVVDWNAFFERHNTVEALLRDDPSGVYERQDFATRDRYRRVVERVARRSNVGEQDVARRAVELAARGMAESPGPWARRLLPDRQGPPGPEPRVLLPGPVARAARTVRARPSRPDLLRLDRRADGGPDRPGRSPSRAHRRGSGSWSWPCSRWCCRPATSPWGWSTRSSRW